MENNTALYYDGTDNPPVEVSVLVFHAAIHLYELSHHKLIQRFPLAATSYKTAAGHHRLYLDEKSRSYVELLNNHPLTVTLSKEISEAKMSAPGRLLKNRSLLILSFLLALLIGFYFLFLSLVPYLGMRMIGINREIELGNELHAAMMEEARLLGEEEDAAGTRLLQAFAGELRLSSRYPIRITLLKSNTLNAYALPGGNVVVYTALLRKIKTPEALAALLAHECTHVNERHSLRSLLRNAAGRLAISVIFGDAGGIAAALAGNVEALSSLRYSRSLEQEADTKGMDLLVLNSIAADGMRQLMQTLQQAQGNLPDGLSFLSSHPLTGERLQEAERYVREHPQQPQQSQELALIFEKLNHW